MNVVVGIVGTIASIACFFISLFAAIDWFEARASIPYLLECVLIGVVIVAQPFGGLLAAVVGFLGMTGEWHWPWWKAGIVAAPIIITLPLFFVGVLAGNILERTASR